MAACDYKYLITLEKDNHRLLMIEHPRGMTRPFKPGFRRCDFEDHGYFRNHDSVKVKRI